MRTADFWRMSLAEWRAALDGFADAQKQKRHQVAWQLQYLLIAAGVEADKVTVAKLLGEDEPARRREIEPEERKRRAVEKMLDEFEKLGLLKEEKKIDGTA